jgi:hypothetical protein
MRIEPDLDKRIGRAFWCWLYARRAHPRAKEDEDEKDDNQRWKMKRGDGVKPIDSVPHRR